MRAFDTPMLPLLLLESCLLCCPHQSKPPAQKSGGFATSVAWKGYVFSGIACCIAEGMTFPVRDSSVRVQLRAPCPS